MSSNVSATLGPIVILLSAAVIAVPLFRKLGLGSVLAYFAAGLLVGPSGVRLFTDPQAILHFSELGVVMFLFIIGLEMRPQRLWSMRRDIFGLGLAQVLLCTALLTALGWLLNLPPLVAFVGAAGFVLSSTAVVAQVLNERGETHTVAGQQAVSILLLEDLAVVPLLVLVAFLAPDHVTTPGSEWRALGVAVAAVGLLVAASRWVINPVFALLAASKAREVMTAGALLVVLGAALLMEASGLSMAMGAFMAGVLLSGSSYRHQIEVDIEPFKGILLGLFFLAVGMSLDLAVVAQQWRSIIVILLGYMAVKGLGIYTVARLFGSNRGVALARMTLFAQGGEFAFVLFAAAQTQGLIDAPTQALLSAVIILSMALTPLVLIVAKRLTPAEQPSMHETEAARDLKGKVLLIGFGRFGQIASQGLLARGYDVSTIDNNPDRIRDAARFGYKVYYGDGARLDILHASGAHQAQVVLVCVDDRQACNHIVRLVKSEFPQAAVLARAQDRYHAIELIQAGADTQIRELLESALALGRSALEHLGLDASEAREVIDNIRLRDQERLSIQVCEGVKPDPSYASAMLAPEPLSPVAATDPKGF
jgi:glutathione-regulated potassium-efflux system protein KefB